MELSLSREVANSAATQELPSILWNPKFHYRVHKSPPLAPILSQIKSIHTIPSYLSKIYFNIVHPPTPWSILNDQCGKLNPREKRVLAQNETASIATKSGCIFQNLERI
jgi:hypothetical protein